VWILNNQGLVNDGQVDSYPDNYEDSCSLEEIREALQGMFVVSIVTAVDVFPNVATPTGHVRHTLIAAYSWKNLDTYIL
jgi:hypothetical protein